MQVLQVLQVILAARLVMDPRTRKDNINNSKVQSSNFKWNKVIVLINLRGRFTGLG